VKSCTLCRQSLLRENNLHIAPEKNVDAKVAQGFGDVWSTFRQDEKSLAHSEREAIFEGYSRIFPWHLLPSGGGVGADIGCGTGRWATMIAPRVAHLHLLDASPDALAVARNNLADNKNASFHIGSVGDIPLPARSLDFAFSLGVLHHVPDTQGAIDAIAEKLKTGGAVANLSLLCIRQPPGLVPVALGAKQRRSPSRVAVASPHAYRHQRDNRRDGLLASCAPGSFVETIRNVEPCAAVGVVCR
jgi:SAM-dependent methyltransferase